MLLETLEPSRLNHFWVGDITYVPLCGGRFCYLATLMDRYSRRIVGWHLEMVMTKQLVFPTLREAIRERQPSTPLIHHTNRGRRDASLRYLSSLRRADIRQSMTRADNGYDNAFMESCFGTLKTELELVEYANGSEAARELAAYIRYYNAERRHSALGYVSPAEFERHLAVPK